jgi:type II secretory pathway component GspD/PulD (secretin)
MKILGIVLLLIGSSAFASTKAFDLKMDLSIEGKHVSSPRIVVKEGEKGTITQESNGKKSFIEVVAKEDKAPNGKLAIHMTFLVGKIASDGTRTIVSQPQIISMPNEKAQITVGENGKPEVLSLSVIANKTTL